MERKSIMVAMVTAMLLLIGTAAAVEDITINPPDANPINVLVAPNAIDPPVNVTYTGWNITGSSTYNITVKNDTSGAVVCTGISGTITTDPQTVALTSCVLPTSSIGHDHTIVASGDCPQGGCINVRRSKYLKVDATLNPVPELTTMALVGAGMMGLFGLVRMRRF